jgi:UDP:flavonoid glycosyltransferase YjiC (YdhE family)
MVVVPQGADQFLHAERAANAGAAIQLLPDDFTPEALAQAVDTLLSTPTYRSNARRIADQIAAMPSPEEVVTTLAAVFVTSQR